MKRLLEREPSENRIESPSTLDSIRTELRRNPSVFYAGETAYRPNIGDLVAVVEVFVAPIIPTFDLDGLNEFMRNLISFPPISIEDAYPWQIEDIYLGKLTFDEVVGIQRKVTITEIVAINGEALATNGIAEGQTQKTEEDTLKRRILVRIYPSAEAAAAVYEYKSDLYSGKIEPISGYSDFRLTADQIAAFKELLK